ncbi:glycosyltransferase family 90 protein [Pseudohyphozyma bogoriensis]|nr:glycosyltransferase family 90 protein [Pseudohyphozyma bogoriensis]
MSPIRPRREYELHDTYRRSAFASPKPRYALPFFRNRIHPFLLVPVFFFGLACSSWTRSELPTPVYQGDPKWDEGYDPFLPPDAPPLRDEDEMRQARDTRAAQRAGMYQHIIDSDAADDEDDDYFDDRGAAETKRPAYFTELDGYLYFPTAAPLVDINIPAAKRQEHYSTPFDSILDPPPRGKPGDAPVAVVRPVYPPFIHPEAPFTNPEALRHAKLPPPLPPLKEGARAKPVAGLGFGQKPNVPPQRPGAPEKKLGANAVAMMKAAKEGIPFKPAKPLDLLAELKEHEALEKEKQAKIERARKDHLELEQVAKFGLAGDDALPRAGAGRAFAGPIPGGRPAVADRIAQGKEMRELAAAERLAQRKAGGIPPEPRQRGGDAFEMNDAALLAAYHAMSEAEVDELSDAELSIFLELEEKIQLKDKGGAPKLRKRSFEVEEVIEEVAEEMLEVKPAEVPVEEPRLQKRSLPEEVSTEEAAQPHVKREAAGKDRVHPISYLIEEAENKWQETLRRQSQTLFQAVVEYQRRYNRKPPLGFDSWWRYAMQNRVILVDEYDQIDDDLRPFFSLSAAEIRARATSIMSDSRNPHHAFAFSLAVRNGMVIAGGPQKASTFSEDVQDVMSEFADTLPDMSMTFSSHTLPAVAVSGEAMARHRHYVEKGHLLAPSQNVEVLENTAYEPWQGLCPPNSTARRVADGLPIDTVPGLSFVSTTHLPAMDICRHPEIQKMNGFTSWAGQRPHLLLPLFSWSKTTMHSDILSAPLAHYYDEPGTIFDWKEKQFNQVLWRGETTGVYHEFGSGWRSSQRERLVRLTSQNTGEREVRFADPKANNAVRRFRGKNADINEYYFDVGFTGSPTQCNKEDKTCELMSKEFRFTPSFGKDRSNKYKYILDVDGNGYSTDFRSKIVTGSVVMKSTIFPEWWSKRIMPWFHYVPVKSDYSDLHDTAAFFIGAPDGSGSHDDLAKKIGENAKKWAADHWREADMAAYQFRLYLEYARLTSRESEGDFDFVME